MQTAHANSLANLRFALLCAALLLICGAVLGLVSETRARENRAHATAIQADILASSVSAALAFDDRASAKTYVDALRADPQVLAVAVYDQRNTLFAGFHRGPQMPDDLAVGNRWVDGSLHVVRPVSEKGETLGTVLLATEPEAWSVKLTRHGGTVLLVVMATLFLWLLGSAYQTLNRRAAELARVNIRLRQEAAERERAEEALLQAKKMEAVGQLTGGIAHDFNNLLQAMQGSFDLILRSAKDNPRIAKLAEVGRQAGERGRKLTSQLLAFSRASQLQLQPVEAGEVVRDMSSMLANAVGPMVELKCDLGAAGIPVLVDRTQLEMAILNLAVNARDAMPEGGTITITAGPVEMFDDPDLEDDLYVALSVADTGAGMPPDVISRAFEPFFTTKGVGQGTGLGLAQVYAMARQSGGVARITSTPGQGSTVTLYLRRAQLAASAGSRSAEPAAPTLKAAASRRVLVVDDDEEVRSFLKEALLDLGHEVTDAASGAEALTLLKESRPDVMLADFAMPGMNGAELAAAARELWPGLPVVFASGFADIAQVKATVGPEATIIRKPFSLERLGLAIEAAN
jgi:signal transduction histidine kinase